jgi:hypothetical protein
LTCQRWLRKSSAASDGSGFTTKSMAASTTRKFAGRAERGLGKAFDIQDYPSHSTLIDAVLSIFDRCRRG